MPIMGAAIGEWFEKMKTLEVGGGIWLVLGLVAGAAFMWFLYVDMKDKHKPESKGWLLVAFGLGLVAAALANGTFILMDKVGLPVIGDGSIGQTLALCLGVIGPIEEFYKVLFMVTIIMHLKVFDEVIDGFVYGAALSIGFATLENVQHLPNLPFLEQLARTATLPLTHTLFAAMWGLAIAWGKLRIGGWKGVLVGIGGVVGAILLHGFYDFIIFQWAATWATTLIAIALWGIVIFACRREAKLVMERKKAAAAAIGRALREAARGAGDG